MTTLPHAFSRRLVALAAVAAIATACGGGGGSSASNDPSTAAGFLRQVTTQFSRGQAGRLWDTLHPADQAVVTRARYMACQRSSGFDLQTFKVLETYADTVDIDGKATQATAVSVQVTSDDGVTTATMHAVKVAGAWRWILSPADHATYRRGACPATSS